MGVATTLKYLNKREIPIQKFNYSLDKRYQNFDKFFAAMQVSHDGENINIINLKPTKVKTIDDEKMHDHHTHTDVTKDTTVNTSSEPVHHHTPC